jgi:hypothetical protein
VPPVIHHDLTEPQQLEQHRRLDVSILAEREGKTIEVTTYPPEPMTRR